MTNSSTTPDRKKWVWILGGLAIILVITALFMYPHLKRMWITPLGPGLELPTYTPTTTDTPIVETATTTATIKPMAGPTQTPTLTLSPTISPTPTPAPLCGGPEVMFVLGVGADSGSKDYLYGLGDVIRVARIDFVTPKVTMLSVPRDLWVKIPDISDHYDITHGKLNQAFLYGGPGMGYYDGPGGAPGLMARVLDLNFGLRVDHYGAVNMRAFVEIVDAVGGIDLYLPNDVDGTPIDDTTEDMGYFYAGQQHFNGNAALRFARIRKRYNDFTRMDNQNMVMCALRAKVLNPEVLPKVPQIVNALIDDVLTDLSPQQISQLLCLLPQVPRENIIFTSLPDEIMQPERIYSPQQKDNVFIMQVDNAVVRDYVERFNAGEWPTQPDEPTCP